MAFNDLPSDIILLIFQHVDYQDLLRLEKVNSRFQALSNDDLLWKNRFEIDSNKWKIINSRQCRLDKNLSFKQLYLNSCPIGQEIEKSNANAHSDSILSKLTDFVFTRYYGASQIDGHLPKIIMFGPGLETTTSCIVTNLLWKSDFQTIGMIPGRDGTGSGLKLKLYKHRPFNLTILYTNVSQLRGNPQQNIDQNKLFTKKNELEYEINPHMRASINEACAYVYVIDTELVSTGVILENSRLELLTIMNECKSHKPLLMLSCVNDNQATRSSSCSKLSRDFNLQILKQEWQMRSCQIIQDKMKDICLGFDWLLNKIK